MGLFLDLGVKNLYITTFGRNCVSEPFRSPGRIGYFIRYYCYTGVI